MIYPPLIFEFFFPDKLLPTTVVSHDDAVKTLDLSELDPVVREPLGRYMAVLLYRILKYRSPLTMAQLSADPQCEKAPILLGDPKYGVISIHVVKNSETGIKAWQFTPESFQVAIESYEDYMSEGMAELVREDKPILEGKGYPIQIRVVDWVQKYAPAGLKNTFLELLLWKWSFRRLDQSG